MAAPGPLLPTDPRTVGPYRLEGRLGAGGQGTVYLGGDEGGRRTAVKLLHPHLITQEVARTRFLAEVELVKRVAPFCTAQVLDTGVENGQPYIVSEFVDGPSLHTSVRGDGPRGGAALQRLALNTVTALAAIHQGGVVHRDFKPGNVLLGPDGPVVIDFGISRALDLSQSLSGSQAVGTPGYMAPEHLDGKAAGPPADLFAWGATMVYAATGTRAFRGETFHAVMRSVLNDEPVLDGLDGPLGAIVVACLDKDPARRPTAAEVGDRLRLLPSPAWNTGAHAGQEPTGGRDSGTTHANTSADKNEGKDRRRGVKAGAAAVALVALIGTTFSVVSALRPGRDADPSRRSPEATPQAAANPDVTKSDGPRPSPDRSKASVSASKPARSGNGTRPRAGGADPGSTGSGRTTSPASRKPARSSPRTVGSISQADQRRYCTSNGYSTYFIVYDGSNSVTCSGGNGSTTAGATTVCRWKYPGHPDVRANGTDCVSYP